MGPGSIEGRLNRVKPAETAPLDPRSFGMMRRRPSLNIVFDDFSVKLYLFILVLNQEISG
jgi:hypothetical protein